MGKPRILERIRRRCGNRIPSPGSPHTPGVIVGVAAIEGAPAILVLPERVVVVAADGAGAADLAGCARAVRVRVVRVCTAADHGGGAAVGVWPVVVVEVVIMVGHVDGRVRLLVVRGQREGGLVRVDVLAVELAAVVAWQAVVPLVVFKGPDAEEGGYAEEEAVFGGAVLVGRVVADNRGWGAMSEGGCSQTTYKTKTAIATMALLMPQAVPHRLDVL